jgi:hypothetical protein
MHTQASLAADLLVGLGHVQRRQRNRLTECVNRGARSYPLNAPEFRRQMIELILAGGTPEQLDPRRKQSAIGLHRPTVMRAAARIARQRWVRGA